MLCATLYPVTHYTISSVSGTCFSGLPLLQSMKQSMAQNRRAQGITAEEMDGYIAEATSDPLKQLWLEQRLFPFGAPYHRSGQLTGTTGKCGYEL